ncbi:MAG: NUDIX domain-containing protein [Chloroflexi bacterium]|nr:NUDIX domain-containing protein [Chloroflexota bacterium]
MSLVARKKRQVSPIEASSRSAAVIISADNQVALIERLRGGRRYYVFPGGGINAGESPVEAMIREVHEELGVRVAAGRLLAVIARRGEKQYYYLARILSGEFGSGAGPEMRGLYPPERGTYRAVWLPIDRLKWVEGWPRPLMDILADSPAGGLPAETLFLEDNGGSPDVEPRIP